MARVDFGTRPNVITNYLKRTWVPTLVAFLMVTYHFLRYQDMTLVLSVTRGDWWQVLGYYALVISLSCCLLLAIFDTAERPSWLLGAVRRVAIETSAMALRTGAVVVGGFLALVSISWMSIGYLDWRDLLFGFAVSLVGTSLLFFMNAAFSVIGDELGSTPRWLDRFSKPALIAMLIVLLGAALCADFPGRFATGIS